MELTLNQALQKAIEAHTAGRLQDAERLYRAILKVQPKHPDVNHNLGVLALDCSKPLEALPFLLTALQSNRSHGQFWVSYINGLIRANEREAARRTLEEGKKIGLSGDSVAQLEQLLQEHATDNNQQIAKHSEGAKERISFPLNEATSAIPEPSEHMMAEVVASYSTRNLVLAENQAKALTEEYPSHPFGWKVLGIVHKMTGRLEPSLVALSRFVKLTPNDAEVHNTLANVLVALGRLDDALKSYCEAIRLKPDFAEAHSNMGNLLRDLGRLGEAEVSCRQAICLQPELALAHNNLGTILSDLGRLKEAEASCHEAIKLNPNFSVAHSNRGNALRALGRLEEAEASYREAIRQNPEFAVAYSNLGATLSDLGRLNEAEAAYREAICLKPDFATAHSNRGATLNELGRFAEAVTSFQAAIRLRPDYALAHSNLGNALRGQGFLLNAEKSFLEAIRLRSDFAEAHTNLGNVLRDLGRLEDAVASYRNAISFKPDLAEAHSNLLFSLNYLAAFAPEKALMEAKVYGAMVSARAERKFTTWRTDPRAARLRIGFVSGDLRNHPVGYFLEGFFGALERCQFDLFLFATTSIQDELTNRIRSHCNHWFPLYGKSDQDAARVIHEQGIHILIDLAGHTAHNRLPVFSYKPAPVQASWLGYFATTGLPEMDYFLGDPIMSPKEESHHFSERICNLPEVWLCATPPAFRTHISDLPALKSGHITFGCFGNLSKINDQVVSVWSLIFQQMPKSILFLKSKQLADPAVVRDVYRRFAERGMESHRLILEGPSERSSYFEAFRRIDMTLDTFPYPGGTTSVDSLWMGVPVLTLRGDRFLARLGESIAVNAKQPEWIAEDHSDFVRKAVVLASDLQSLAATRANLREQVLRSPLFDSHRFAHGFGVALREMSRLSGTLFQDAGGLSY
jgi:protein O-GlcNAc transferase